jgi:transposase-like protein
VKKATFAAVVRAMSTGSTVPSACKASGISTRTFYEWVQANEDAQKQYREAKEEQLEAYADQTLEIADEVAGDRDSSSAQVQAAKLRIDVRFWHLERLRPKKYGKRVELAGSDDSPLQIVVTNYATAPEFDDADTKPGETA